MAQYSMELISENRNMDAVHIFEKYGASANLVNFNIYKQLIDQILNVPETIFDDLTALRNMIHSLNENILKSETQIDHQIVDIFTKYEYILHFATLQKALTPITSPEVERLKLHLAISMVRYMDLMSPDKILYEAGMACRVCF